MATLPVELLTPIFQNVHRISRDDLISCMQCNKQFFNIGFAVLYKHVTLRVKDALRFEKAIATTIQRQTGERWPPMNIPPTPRSSLGFSHIRSLRVIIPGDGRDYGYSGTLQSASKIVEPGIDALCRVLPHLSKLRSFSIMSYNGHRLNTFDETLGAPGTGLNLSSSNSRKAGPHINLLARLVASLPLTVSDLSIDLSELSRYAPVDQCDLCATINVVAPRLEHLNLHLRSYCGNLFKPDPRESPRYRCLKSVIIRIHGFNAKLCCKPFNGAFNHFAYLNLDSFTERLRNLIVEGRFPTLKQCILISKRRPREVRQHADAKWTIYVREIVSDQTAAIPRIFLDNRTPAQGNTFTTSARTTVRLPSNCSFIDRKHWGKEYVGKSGSIRRFVEGQAGWVCFAFGPHLPGMRTADVRTAYEQGYDVRAPVPSLASEFRKKHDASCKLWNDEDLAGYKLLEPAVWSGVLDNQVVTRTIAP